MPKNIIIPQENKPTITESIKEAVIPTVHASDDEEKAAVSGIGGGG